MQVDCGTIILIITDVPNSIWNTDQITLLAKLPIYCDASKHKDVTVNENVSSLDSAIF